MALDFSFADLTQSQQPVNHQSNCPFLGPKAFGVPDDGVDLTSLHSFFGREAMVDRLVKQLEQSSFLAVLGAPGSGKSSLVMAGLVPTLQQRQPRLQVAYFKPGHRPQLALETAIAPLLADRPALLVVDQFEELFTLGDEPDRSCFLTNLLALPGFENDFVRDRLKIVIIMQTSFIDRLIPYHHLTGLLELNIRLIPAMTVDELCKAIDKQAQVAQLRFDPDLLNTIMEDISGEVQAMSLLQYIMQILWQYRHDCRLSTNTYYGLNCIRQAIAETATEFYHSLSTIEQIQVGEILARLIWLKREVQLCEVQSVARRVPLKTLIFNEQDQARTEWLIEKLVGAQLLIITSKESSRENEVEVAQEILIHYWSLASKHLNRERVIVTPPGPAKKLLSLKGHPESSNTLAFNKEGTEQKQPLPIKQAVQISLLGPVQIKRGEVVIDHFRSRKSLALLGYLVSQNRPISRGSLANLLWPDKPETVGRRDLRWTLNYLSDLLPEATDSTFQTIAFRLTEDVFVDTIVFEMLRKRGDAESLERAVALYQGQFLAELNLKDTPELELWLLQEQEHWQQQVTSILAILVEYYLGLGNHNQAKKFAAQWLKLEPWQENAHYQMMRLLTLNGERTSALIQYKTCQRILSQELDIGPMPETVALYEQIKAGKLIDARS